MKKRLALIITLILSIAVFIGCSKSTDKKEEVKESKVKNIKVVTPAGIPNLSMIKMFKENLSIGKNIKVDYEIAKTSDILSSKVISKEADFAIVPTNLAAKLYNKGIPYKLASSSVWGSLYLVSTENINSFQDLKGKKINMIGRGLTPDITFKYLLSKNNIDYKKDLNLNYLNGSTELAPAFISGKSTISIMPEPMLSKVMMKKKETKIILDIQKEWAKTSNLDSGYPQASLIVKKDLIDKNPELVKRFLDEYEKSTKWVNENPSRAGEYAEFLKTGLKEKIVEKSIPRSNIKFVSSKDAKNSIKKYLNVLKEYSADSVGGKLPDDNFYYQK